MRIAKDVFALLVQGCAVALLGWAGLLWMNQLYYRIVPNHGVLNALNVLTPIALVLFVSAMCVNVWDHRRARVALWTSLFAAILLIFVPIFAESMAR